MGHLRSKISPSDRFTRLTNLHEFNAVDSEDDAVAISSNQIAPSRPLGPREIISSNIPSRHNVNAVDLNRLTELQLSSQPKTNSSSPYERERFVLSEHNNNAQSKSSLSSTTALLILFVCYIIWQCFRSQSKQRKCLDEWPTLLTPFKDRHRDRRRQSDEECEMQTVGTVRGANLASDKSNKSAVLRVKCDNSQEPEVEIVQTSGGTGNCDGTTDSRRHNKKSKIRENFMRNSLVVAANQVARPKVKLISDRVKRYIDVEANSEEQSQRSVSRRFARLLRSSGLFRKSDAASASNESCEVGDEHQTRDQQIQVTMQEGKAEGSAEDTIEVVVHRNIESSVSNESLLGFAGSFLDPTVNSSGVGSGSSLQQSLGADLNQSHSVASHTNLQIPPTSSMDKSQLNVVNDLISSCGCSLARSKSQTSQSYCPTEPMSQLLTTSPANIRPCCSVSPSAMARHDTSPSSAHHHNQQAHQQHHKLHQHCHNHHAHLHNQPDSSLCRPFVGPNVNRGTVFCGKDRAKHHYENYYDDEQEDAYRRLTASIGAQFGLAIDQQSALLPATSTVACTVACKCNSAPSRQNIVLDGPVGAGDVSLGDSDSGNFSLANKQRVNSDSICNDSNCSLCLSSLLTTPSHQTMDIVDTQTGLDPMTSLHGPLVSRWHTRRRSTLYARQPRRMSIAGVACQQPIATAYGATPQHFLHRASIASDGANSFHPHHHQLNARQIYPPGQFCANKKSNYSSSAGSSSGIGFSGSQCLNTPTTGAFPYQSFASTRPFNELILGGKMIQPSHQTFVTEPQADWHVATTNDQQPPNECVQYDPSLGLTSRKFSLPVQLESKTAGNLTASDNASKSLFAPQRGDLSGGHSPTSLKVAQAFKLDQTNDQLSHKISSINQKSAEQYRRSSQTITRQSSFWLEDPCADLITSTQTPPLDNPRPMEQPIERSRDSENTSNLGDIDQAAQISSSSESPQSPCDKEQDQGKFDAGSSTTKSAYYKIHHSSSSSTSSPSPDFHKRQRHRLRNRSAPASSIKKRQLLSNLKQRRCQRPSGTYSVQRRHGTQITNPSQKQDTFSTDDDCDRTKNDDNLSSFDREVAKAIGGRTILDVNSTSLERQCRDLWKLRATLHDDALVGDNWTNYHQRLNRRYDSGYKSIENQFSSSIEGNVPNVLNLSSHQAPVTVGGENSSREPGRPQSGCSGMIQGRIEESSTDLVSSILSEETQALLDNCDDQQDEQ